MPTGNLSKPRHLAPRGVFLLLSLFCVIGSLGAQDLDFALPQRYIDFQLHGVLSPSFALTPKVDILTGDYPYVVRFNENQLALYTGLPLYAPWIFSLGSINQMGYRDDYSLSTPFAVLLVGWQNPLGFLKIQEGFVSTWGWRWGRLSGAFGYQFTGQEITSSLGWFDRWGSVVMEIGPLGVAEGLPNFLDIDLGLKGKFKIADPWSFSLGINRTSGNSWSFFGGLGTYLYLPAADTLKEREWDTIAAHRGSLLLAPENTLPAINLALKDPKVQAVEVDIQRTADGAFVLIHDDLLIRYNQGWEKVSDLTLEEFQSLDFGSWFSPKFKGTKVGTLEDLGPLATSHPSILWILDLKNIGDRPQEVKVFLDKVGSIFAQSSQVRMATGNWPLVKTLKLPEMGLKYPLGLQVDVARKLFLWGDLFPPLLEWELKGLLENSQAEEFFLISSKISREETLQYLAEKMGKTLYFWNFHDRIYGKSTGFSN